MSRLMLSVVLASLAMIAVPAEVDAKPRRAKAAAEPTRVNHWGNRWEVYYEPPRPWLTLAHQELFPRAPLRFKRLSMFRHSTLASMTQRSGR